MGNKNQRQIIPVLQKRRYSPIHQRDKDGMDRPRMAGRWKYAKRSIDI